MPKILVVDDEAVALRYVSRLLKAQGHTVITEEDGRAALKRLETEPVDLVLADVKMPWMDGCDLTAAIRASANLRHVPVILMSGVVGPEFVANAMGHGATAFIQKPVSSEVLIECLEQHLATS